MTEAYTKGVVFIHMEQFLRAELGEAGRAQVLEKLGPAASASLTSARGHLWYPLADLVEVQRVLAETHFAGDPAQMQRFGFFDGSRQVGQIYRFLLRLLEPSFLLKQSNKLWRAYMNVGEITVEDSGPRGCLVRLGGYDPLHPVHCFDNLGAFGASLALCGAQDAKVEHLECRLDGAPACAYRASW